MKNPTVREPAPTNDKMPTFLLLDKTLAKLPAIVTLQTQKRSLQVKNGQIVEFVRMQGNAADVCMPFSEQAAPPPPYTETTARD